MSAKRKNRRETFGIYQKTPAALPPGIQEQCRNAVWKEPSAITRRNTDRFAIDEYKRLFDADVLP
jgi:hypothetical protein